MALAIIPLSMSAFAGPKVPTHVSIQEVLKESRDSFFAGGKRRYYLTWAHNQMKAKLAKELNTTVDNLPLIFAQKPETMNHLYSDQWWNLQAEFYVSLHQEALSEKWKKMSAARKFTDYGKNIAESMLIHFGSYSPVKEGMSYTRWQNMTTTKNGKKETYRLPFFLFASTPEQLIQIDAHAPYEALFPKSGHESSMNPSLQTFISNVGSKERAEYQDLAEKVQLNHRIYIRAVANSAKTVASVHYLTGEFSWDQTKAKVEGFVRNYCEGCSSKERSEFLNSAMIYVKNKKKELSQEYKGAVDIVTSFCSDLKANGYDWTPAPLDEAKPKDEIYRRDMNMAVQDNTRVVTNRNAQMDIYMYRMAAIQKSINEHDLGVLFVTDSLSRLSKTGAVTGTHLACLPGLQGRDAQHVRAAIREATSNVETYIKEINGKVRGSTFSKSAAKNTLEYFTQTNVAATAEAIATFPQGMNHALAMVLSLDKDAKRRSRWDKTVSWGGAIIGIALVISGIGAPEGVAVLLAVGAMTKSLITGAYNFARAQQEKEFHRMLNVSRKALGQHFYLEDNLSQHYNDFRELRINYIIDFAGAALSFVRIHRLALGKYTTVPKAHGAIRKTLQKCKEAGKEVGQDQLAAAILQAVGI